MTSPVDEPRSCSRVELQDRFDNRCADVECEVVLAASHGAEFGDGPVEIVEVGG